jgi:hypothetical protein
MKTLHGKPVCDEECPTHSAISKSCQKLDALCKRHDLFSSHDRCEGVRGILADGLPEVACRLAVQLAHRVVGPQEARLRLRQLRHHGLHHRQRLPRPIAVTAGKQGHTWSKIGTTRPYHSFEASFRPVLLDESGCERSSASDGPETADGHQQCRQDATTDGISCFIICAGWDPHCVVATLRTYRAQALAPSLPSSAWPPLLGQMPGRPRPADGHGLHPAKSPLKVARS